MIQALIQYIIKYGHLELPGIGSLKWSKQASYWEQHKFVAPQESIILENIDVTVEKAFYHYLSEALNISFEQANLQFDEFINQFKTQKIASLNLGHLGTLHKNDSIFSWNNLYNANMYYKDVEIEIGSFVQEQPTESFLAKDYWWLWAIGFILIAAVLIIYKIN